jgi:hypothetical protein
MGELLHTLFASFSLDRTLWRDLITHPSAKTVPEALLIVLFAGLSEAIAQSVALFLNKVSPRRFVVSLFVSAVIFTCGFIFYVLSIGFVTGLLSRTSQPFSLLIKSVSLAYAPLILSFLSLIPYFGRAITIVLSTYHLLAIIIAVKVIYTLTDGEAVLSVVAGAVLFFLLRGTLGRPLILLARTIRNRTAGVKLEPTSSLLPRYQKDEEK